MPHNLGRLACILALATPLPGGQPHTLNSKAPELVTSKDNAWLNAEPITLKAREGKVTIVHFWTFDCINCRHNLPSYARWQERFAGRDVAIIGVHTPELPREAVRANVEKKVREYGITYPVLLDPRMTNWNRWNQQFWPCVYIIDKHGKIRYRWDGELNYGGANGEAKLAELIEELLRD